MSRRGLPAGSAALARIARGYSADVLAVDGSALDDTTTMQRPRLIVHAGAIAHDDL